MASPHLRFSLPLVACALAAPLCFLLACSSGTSSTARPDASAVDSSTGDEGGEDAADATSADVGPSDTGVPDTSSPQDAAFDGPYPLVFPSIYEGPAAANLVPPQVVTITFQGDPMAAQLQAFGQGVDQSAWWNTAYADYCLQTSCTGQPGVSDVIPGTPAPVYVDSDYRDYSDAGTPIWSVIANEIAHGNVPVTGQSLSSVLYVLYLPSTTDVQLDRFHSCTDFYGYHDIANYPSDGGTTPFIYAVVMECPQETLAGVTTATSHEVLEATTDNMVFGVPYGWSLDTNDLNAWGWYNVLGPELGDLCEDPLRLQQDRYTDGTYTYQRIWSKSAAAALHDPCVPVPSGSVYFNAYPQEAFFEMDVGETRTFTVTGFSTAPHADWYVNATEDFAASQPGTTPYLSMSLSGSTIHDGATLQVKMTLLADPTNGTYSGYTVANLYSTDTPTVAAASSGHVWPFVVMSRVAAQDAGINEPGQLDRSRRRRWPHRAPPAGSIGLHSIGR